MAAIRQHPANESIPVAAQRSPIVSPIDLAAELEAADAQPFVPEEEPGALARPVVLDVRWTLSGSDRDAFAQGHIPGAIFVDLDRELTAPPGPGGRHPLPPVEVLERLMDRAAIGADTPVVVCGQRDTSIAARGWWLLRWVGHRHVRVLDGGFEAWQGAGLPIDRGLPEEEEADQPVGAVAVGITPGAMPVVDADGAAALAASDGCVLLDARAAERYRGDLEPIDPVPGHIPGALNLPLTEIHYADGRLRSAEDLRLRFAERGGVRPGASVAASCGSGVTACSLILAAEVAGMQLSLYPGSYSEWCALGRPVERA